MRWVMGVKTKSAFAIGLACAMVMASAACGGTSASEAKGRVYMISQKVENNDQFLQLGKQFTKDTGIPVSYTHLTLPTTSRV